MEATFVGGIKAWKMPVWIFYPQSAFAKATADLRKNRVTREFEKQGLKFNFHL